MYKTSEQLNELAGALAKAQGEITSAALDAENPFFKSSYSTLGAVWNACRTPLSSNGLSVVQLPTFEGGFITLTTRLMHESGQWIESVLIGELDQNKGISQLQAMGGAITYLRRYSLAAMIGITSDEDTDGNGGKPTTAKQSPAARPLSAEKLKTYIIKKAGMSTKLTDGKQKDFVASSLNAVSLGNDDDRHSITYYLRGKNSVDELTTGEASALIDWIGANKANEYQPVPEAVEEARFVLDALISQESASVASVAPVG